MKLNKKKILMSLLAASTLFSLTTANSITANEQDEENEVIQEDTVEKIDNDSIEIDEGLQKNEITTEDKIVEESTATALSETISPMSGGVSVLVEDSTTLGSAFPDSNFRTYVAETILGKTAGSYDETTMLTAANINSITTRTAVAVNDMGISSLEGIQHFTNLTSLNCGVNQISELNLSNLTKLSILNCHNNKLTEVDLSKLTNLTRFMCQNNQLSELDISSNLKLEWLGCHNNMITELDVTNHIKLTQLMCYNNQIEVLNVSGLDNLTRLEVQRNPIKVLNISTVAKSNITILSYNNLDIDSLDLSGFDSLTSLAQTKSTNANLNNVTVFQISGTRGSDGYLARVEGNAGDFFWDSTIGYYVISPNLNAIYRYQMPVNGGVGYVYTPVADCTDITAGGIMDGEGNLVLGATLSNVLDGTITLSSGGTIITAEGVFTFEGSVSLKDGIITTNDNYSFEKNIATYDESTDTTTVSIGEIVTSVETGNCESSISTIGSEMSVPSGTVIINNDGDELYTAGEATVDSDGNVTSEDVIIIVPSDKTGDVTTDGSEITFPVGVVVDDGSTSITYPGNIIYDTEDNTIKYLPVDGLFNEDGTLKDGVTQEDITNSKDFVSSLDDSALKTELQNKVEEAQKELDERNAQKAVDDLFDKDGNIKDTVTQEDIDNAQDLVNKVKDEDKKAELQDKLDEAQKQLDEKNFVVLEAFKVFTGTGSVYTKIDAPVEKFTRVYVDGKELAASNYEVTSGSTVVTLSEAYLKTLANGTYDVGIEFSSGAVVNTKLTVNVSNNPSTKPTDPTKPTDQTTDVPTVSKPSVNPNGTSTSGVNTVNTGDQTNMVLLYGLLISSLLGFAVVTKKRKMQ